MKEEKWEKGLKIFCVCAVMLVTGYLVGRFTAISDLKHGYLNAFIPK